MLKSSCSKRNSPYPANETSKYFLIMLFAKTMLIKEIKHDWAKKISGYKKMAEVHIRFVPVATLHNAESDNSNYFSLSLNLSSTPEVKLTKC